MIAAGRRLLKDLFVAFALSAMAGLSTLLFYWALFDNKAPVTPVSVQLTDMNGIPQSHFKAGEPMLVRRENCARKDALVFISRELVRLSDNEALVMPSGPYNLKEGCSVSVNQVVLPNFLKPGLYEYRVTMGYSNNPLVSGAVRLQVFTVEVVGAVSGGAPTAMEVWAYGAGSATCRPKETDMTTKTDHATLQSAFTNLRAFMVDALAYTGPETVRLNGAVCKQGDDGATRRFWLQNDGSVSATTDPSDRHPA